MSNYVYAIINRINLKLYFGSHSWDGEGLDPNYYGSGKLIKRAVKKYGKDNFIVYPIKFYNSVEECRKAEEELLTKYNIANNQYCYNIKNAAVGWTSEDVTGEKHPQYGKRGKDSHSYGRHHTEDTKRKMSQAKKGRTHTENTRNKMSQAHKGKKLSEDTKRKLSRANKGKTISEETRKKLSQVNKGKTASEETRKKLSQANNYKKIPVVAIQIDTGKIRVFESIIECARKLNSNSGHIYNCLKGRQKTCKGYLIKYLEQLESGIYEGITEGIAE